MFDYGRYTPYILSSYSIAGLVLVGLVVWSILRAIDAKKKLDAVEPPQRKQEKQS
jgi:heme exporter protein CcmD